MRVGRAYRDRVVNGPEQALQGSMGALILRAYVKFWLPYCYELLRLSLYRSEVGSWLKSSSKEVWIQGLDILAVFLV